jgi:hypothetical protein
MVSTVQSLSSNKICFHSLLCGEVAHQSNRAYVFEEFAWKVRVVFHAVNQSKLIFHRQGEYYPWPWPTRVWPWQTRASHWPLTPLNALLSGPLVGGPWEAGDKAPRSVHVDYWEKVCPPEERTVIMSNTLKDPVRWDNGDVIFKHMVEELKKEPGRCVDIQPSPEDGFPQTFDLWLVGDPRGIPMSKLFLDTPTSRLFGTSPLVASA